MPVPSAATANFKLLIETYAELPIEFPQLKAITMAHWAVESAWGKTTLAASHMNYASLLWPHDRAALPGGMPINYGGKRYAAFTNHEQFIKTYWARFDYDTRFYGWRTWRGSAQSFITFLAPVLVSGRNPCECEEMTPSRYLTRLERAYVRDVLRVHDRHTQEIFSTSQEQDQ